MIRSIETVNVFTGALNVKNKCRHGRPSHSTDPRSRHHRSGSLLPIMVWLDRTGATGDCVCSMVSGLRSFWIEYMQSREVRRGSLVFAQAGILVHSRNGSAE